jgi:hypothetical protein
MIKKAICLAFALTFLAVTAQAAPKTLQVEFQYDKPAQAFNLYMDGSKVCNTNATAGNTNPTAGTMECTDIEIPYGVHLFTMTAVVDGMETQHSPAYVWPYAPEPAAAPVFLNFSIAVDGKNVQIGPANP